MWVVYLAFWGEGEGLSTSGVLRLVLDLCRQRRDAFETQGKTRTKADEKKRKTVCHNLWKRTRGGRRAKKGEKKEWNEIGDRWTKADDKKGRCFIIYEITKGTFPWEHEYHWTREHHEFLKKNQNKTSKPKKVPSGTVGLRNLRLSSCEQPELILLLLFIHDQYNRIIS